LVIQVLTLGVFIALVGTQTIDGQKILKRTEEMPRIPAPSFGKKRVGSPSVARIRHVAEPAHDTPRPVRGTSYREASVVYDTGYTRRGIVLDYTPTGVRLRFPTNEIMPPFVTVHAGAVNVRGPARVVWQEGTEVGFVLI
jgi:hypothetical protein